MGLVDVKGIVATLTPAFDRARLTRGTLDVLGLFGVPIGVGSDGGDIVGKHKADTFVEWARPYMPPRYSAASAAFKPGRILLHNVYESAAKKSLTLVIIASLKDAALFLRDEEDLFVQKTCEVVIMGGVEPWDESGSGPTLLVPDTANNNTFDMDAARYFHKRVQEVGIPLIIITRWSAYAAKVPVSCYNELAANGSWIGCRLRNAQRASIESLWSRAASPAGSEEKHGLPDRCDRAWFLKTFCANADATGRGPKDTIWDLIAGFMQYDTVATLAAIPILRKKLFTPVVVNGLKNTEHLVIGRTEEDHNIMDTDELSRFLNHGFRRGLAYHHHRKTQFILMLQPRWSNNAENHVAFILLRSLFDLGIFDCAGLVLQPVPGEGGQGKDSAEEFGKETRHTLSNLGLAHIPVLVADPNGTTGVAHLKDLYGKVTPAGISLVITGSLDVAADFAESDPKAFVTKTQNVILVGGAISAPGPDGNGTMLQPDPDAQNNQLDMIAARRFIETAQKLLVPLVSVSRYFVQAVQIPRVFYDILGDPQYGGNVGKELLEVQKAGSAQLWHAVRASPKDRAARRNLPDRCDKEWFIKTFCSDKAPASDSDKDVWNSMNSFNIYNAQAILLALPPVFNRFVKGTPVTVRAVKHTIIGKSSENPGIVDPSELRKLVLQCIVTGTRLNSSIFDFKNPPEIKLDEGQSKVSTWCYDEHKDALLWLLPLENRKDVPGALSSMTSDDLWKTQS
jgi:inosine-uridine nucleoside N-ribohydrolase